VLGFTIPRVPAFSFNDATPIAKATGNWNSSVPTYFNTAPANFSFPAFAALKVDTDSNYLPLKFNYLRATVYDLDTLVKVATGDLGSRTLPAKAFPEINLPLNFTYVASNSSDQTCAYSHRLPGEYRFNSIVQIKICMMLARAEHCIQMEPAHVRFPSIYHRDLNVSNISLAMKIRLVLDLGIAGLPTEHHASTQISDAACPIELSITHG
jgi:hypothetical protein